MTTPGRVLVVQADTMALPLPDGCADAVLVSPPYWWARKYLDGGVGNEATPAEYLEALWAATAEWKRVLKPTGSMFVNLGDTYAGRANDGPSSHAGSYDGVFSRAERPRRPKRYGSVRAKSLHGLPAAYALGCSGMLGSLTADYLHRDLAAQLTRVLLRDLAAGWLTLAQAEAELDAALEEAAGLLGGVDPGLNLIWRRDQITEGTWIWWKLNGIPESVTDRTRSAHEYVHHFTLQEHYYAGGMDLLREPHEMRPQRRPGGHKQRQRLGVLPAQTWSTSQRDDVGVDGDPRGKIPASVWPIPTQPLDLPDFYVPAGPTDADPWQWVPTLKDAWRMLELGLVPPASSWPRVDRDELRVAPDHHAAFPPELPRRLIVGWTPPGICVDCGQGRVAVTRYTGGGGTYRAQRRPGEKDTNLADAAERFREILGWACDCCPHSDHPATGEPSSEFGRYANAIDEGAYEHFPPSRNGKGGLGDRPKVGRVREWHLDRWTDPPPTRRALVVDPMGGAGTTAMAAMALGRDVVTVDRAHTYGRFARWRCEESGHWQKVIAATTGRKVKDLPSRDPAQGQLL